MRLSLCRKAKCQSSNEVQELRGTQASAAEHAAMWRVERHALQLLVLVGCVRHLHDCGFQLELLFGTSYYLPGISISCSEQTAFCSSLGEFCLSFISTLLIYQVPKILVKGTRRKLQGCFFVAGVTKAVIK